MNKRTPALAVLATLCCFAAGCGHSEEEWQAQLGRYHAELTRSEARHQEALALQAQLREARGRVADLEHQLLELGVNLETKDRTVEQLTDDLAEVRAALASYKARARTLEAIKTRMLALRSRLEELTKIGLKVSVRKNRMVISLPGDVLFDTGRTELKADGRDALLKVAETIRNDPALRSRDFQVAGHTDSKPLAGPPFFDNWGLSLMRARQVLLLLTAPQQPQPKPGQRAPVAGGGLPLEHWSAAGYADTDPVATNEAPEGMKRNRRVELVVVPNVEEMLDLRKLGIED
jgi:chemotaxis protein MotB